VCICSWKLSFSFSISISHPILPRIFGWTTHDPSTLIGRHTRTTSQQRTKFGKQRSKNFPRSFIFHPTRRKIVSYCSSLIKTFYARKICLPYTWVIVFSSHYFILSILFSLYPLHVYILLLFFFLFGTRQHRVERAYQ
jgi:hypothetical protein